MNLTQAAATVTAIGVIGGGALTLDGMHVATSDFEKYLDNQESRYVLELKKDIRELRRTLQQDPDDPYLIDFLEDLLDELCELRPSDRECQP